MVKKQQQHVNPFAVLVAVVLLSGIGWVVYNYHFVPLEHRTLPQTMAEDQRIMFAAQTVAPQNEINGIPVKLELGRQIGEYALVQAIPLKQETDPLQIILQKIDGQWQPIASGTAFPELESRLPKGLLQ